MNFKWVNKQGVESDTGFVVQLTCRFTAEYRENGKVFEVDIESGFCGDKPAICFSRKQFSRWSNSESEQERIIANFEAALAFQGLVPIAD